MAGTAHGSNQLATRFFRTEVPDVPEAYSIEMPAHSPQLGRIAPGGHDYGPPGPGRRRAGPKNLPSRSWLEKRESRKRKKKSAFRALMG
jgi:hypothetical protein